MSYYNMTNMTEASNLMVFIQQVNIASEYLFEFFILIALFVILFIAFKNFSIRTTMPIILFLCTIIGIFLAMIEMIPDFIVYILILATAGLVIASIFINPEG